MYVGDTKAQLEGDIFSAQGIDLQRGPNTVVRTVAGGGSLTYFGGDGGPALDALLNSPRGVAAGPDGTLYIADTGNYRVRKISGDGTINTVAGNGSYQNYYTPNNDGKPAKEVPLDSPKYVTPAPDGSFYITDRSKHRIRKVSPDGIISTIAGSLSAGDGAGTKAYLGNPDGIAAAADGSFYVADPSTNRVRKVAPDGTVSTVAGTGRQGYSGDGGPAIQVKLNRPSSVAISADGTVFVADQGNHRIRRIDPSGMIFTVAGTGTAGFSGDGGPAVQAQLSGISGIALGPDGSLFINDSGNNRIRRVEPDGIITTVSGGGSSSYDGYAGSDSRISGQGIAVGTGGSIYVAQDNRIRKVGSFLAGNETGNLSVPSVDGSELYVFTNRGRISAQ